MKVRNLLMSFCCVWSCATAAQAQMADVPRFNTDGDFFSARVQGNRGTYPHGQWLVVESEDPGLNCRDVYGDVVVSLAYGAVVDSVFDTDDAIALVAGQPWLKVRASQMDVLQVNGLAASYTCYVRANRRYIAPINPDTQ